MEKAWRNDGYEKVTGAALFTDDISFPRMLYCAPVYTDFVHAKIKNIFLDEAKSAEGVVRVITADDICGNVRFGQIFKDYYMLVTDEIRSSGDVIALVVAKTMEIAVEAADKIRVDAEVLPAVFDAEKALNDNTVLVHKDRDSNLINKHQIRRGKNIEIALKECDVVVSRTFSTGYVEHAYIEPESAVCRLRSDGVMEVYGSMQHPFSTRRFVAAILGVRLADVEVIETCVGGGFGGKDDTAAIVCARTALAAKLTGCPVKMTYKREWSMRESYKRHPYKLKYDIGLKEGLIHAVKCYIIADGGAYASVTPWVTWRSTVQCCGPYKVANVHCDVYGVYTNNIFTGAFRGFGSPQVNFSIEQLVEECAEIINVDPVEFRKNNMLCQGDETITSQKLEGHVVSLGEVLDKVLKNSNYNDKIKKCGLDSITGKYYGIGLAISYRGCSLGAEGMDFNAAILNCQFDGSILLDVAIHENGQGAESAMVILAAEQLGVDKSRIRYNRASTSRIPDGGTTVASRGTLMGGGAVVDAANKLKKIIAKVVCKDLDCEEKDVFFAEDCVCGGGKKISWNQAMNSMFIACEYPFAFGYFQAPKVSWDESFGVGNAYFTWGYHANVAEVEVDTDKKSIKVIKVYAVHDIGKAVNKIMLEGQVYGGIVQGMGMALFEDLKVENGRVMTLNFNKYKIPRSFDVPEMYVEFVENPDSNTPSGAKGIGEPALELISPAIANALHNALSKRFYSYPIKLD